MSSPSSNVFNVEKVNVRKKLEIVTKKEFPKFLDWKNDSVFIFHF